MGAGIGLEIDRVRQQGVKLAREQPDADAQDGRDPHGGEHVAGRLLGAQAAVLAEEHVVGKFQPGVQEGARRGQRQHQGHRRPVVPGRRRDDHGLADEAAEQGEGRDGEGADHVERHRQRHGPVETAQFRELVPAGHMDDRARAHEQKPLVDDVGEGVGGGPVEGHLRADADAHHHVAHLADDVVGQQPPAVVLEHRVDHPVDGHHRPQPDQGLGARKGSDQHVHRGLGGKGAQENGAGDGGLGIGIGEPGVQRRHRRVDHEGDQDQQEGEPAFPGQGPDQEGSGLQAEEHDPAEQQHAAGDMHHEIAEPGGDRRLPPRREDQVGGRERHDLPGDEQGEPVPGEDHAKGAAHVQVGGHVLFRPLHVKRVDRADQGHDGEHPGEHQAQLVHLADEQLHAREIEGAVVSGRHRRHGGDGEQRDADQPGLAPAPAEKGDRRRAEDEKQPGMDPLNHSSPRPA